MHGEMDNPFSIAQFPRTPMEMSILDTVVASLCRGHSILYFHIVSEIDSEASPSTSFTSLQMLPRPAPWQCVEH